MSERTQRAKREAVFGCGLDVFWSETEVPDGIGGAIHPAEISVVEISVSSIFDIK